MTEREVEVIFGEPPFCDSFPPFARLKNGKSCRGWTRFWDGEEGRADVQFNEDHKVEATQSTPYPRPSFLDRLRARLGW
jgi:hypothetical protein